MGEASEQGRGHNLDGFCRRYLEQWDRRATVRGLQRSRVTREAVGSELFPRALQPLVRHPDVVALGEDKVRELLVRTAYAWQGEIAALEIVVVTDLCGKLATRSLACPLPDSARQVALTIATDEAYHAFAAREFIADVQRHTGLEPGRPVDKTPILAASLDEARLAAPEELQGEAETLALCFFEHLVTDSLFGLSRDTEPDNPFHVAVREHLVDEGRHQGYFRNLLRHLWAEMDEERRSALGRVVPVFLDAFLYGPSTMRRDSEDLLREIGLRPAEAQRIAAESHEAAVGDLSPEKHRLPTAQHCLKLVASAGLLEHAPTRALLAESGWLAPEAAGARSG